MIRSHRRMLAVAAAILAAGCATESSMYAQPYALFEPERRSSVEDTRPAFIMRIDGQNVDATRIDPVPVGVRMVEVSIPGPRGMSNPGRDTLRIDAKACTRYFLAARRSSRTDDDWRAFVSAEEPLGDCRKKFGM